MTIYLIFCIYYLGEQGWDKFFRSATTDVAVAVQKANEYLREDRNSENNWYSDRYGYLILPIKDGERVRIGEPYDYEIENEPIPYVLKDVDGDDLFTVEEVIGKENKYALV